MFMISVAVWSAAVIAMLLLTKLAHNISKFGTDYVTATPRWFYFRRDSASAVLKRSGMISNWYIQETLLGYKIVEKTPVMKQMYAAAKGLYDQ
jgi:hypothetical protein